MNARQFRLKTRPYGGNWYLLSKVGSYVGTNNRLMRASSIYDNPQVFARAFPSRIAARRYLNTFREKHILF